MDLGDWQDDHAETDVEESPVRFEKTRGDDIPGVTSVHSWCDTKGRDAESLAGVKRKDEMQRVLQEC